ncbi:MAG: COX15/CtaA family protein [Nitrosopumilus sp.]
MYIRKKGPILVIQYLALTTMIVLCSLILLEVYSSVDGIDLSCTEWSFCSNRVLSSEEYHAEWIYGLVAVTAGILTITTMAACIINKKSGSKIKITSSIATVSIITPVILNASVIDLKLHAILVAVHLGVGILLILMVLATTLFAFRISRNPPVV